MGLSIRGIQEAQANNVKRMALLKATGGFGRLIFNVTATLHRFMGTVTHVDVGALKSAEMMEVQGLRGQVFISPGAQNPKSGERPADYGPFENARGGDHAFFDRTVARAPEGIRQGVRAFLNQF